MDLALLFFALLWGFAGGGASRGEQAPRLPPPRRRRPPPPPSSAPSSPQVSVPPPPSPPWPQVKPAGLPPFPGSGWEYDEPPPLLVQQRAGQLVSQLWAKGKGAHKIENIAGRWIAFQAAVVASGKNGVVAFRVKRAAARPSSAPTTTAKRPPPQLPAPRATPATSPAPRVEVVPPAPPAARPTLRQGAGMGALVHLQPHVKYVQRVLGLSLVDGKFGPGTFKAVDQFQRSNDLKVDGIVGPQTWAALDRHPRARALLQARA